MSRYSILFTATALVAFSHVAQAKPQDLPAPDFGYASLAIISLVTACVAGMVALGRRRARR